MIIDRKIKFMFWIIKKQTKKTQNTLILQESEIMRPTIKSHGHWIENSNAISDVKMVH